MLRDCGIPDDEPEEGCTFRPVRRRYLLNVARNFGGSIGISLANTELMQRVQFHQSRLVESAIPSSSNYQHTLDRVAEFFVSQGSSLITAQQQAVGWIGQTILKQSVLISYMDVFWGCSIFALLMVPLAPTVGNVDQTTETDGHG
jgi:DHA2 family multidrug resistance protein